MIGFAAAVPGCPRFADARRRTRERDSAEWHGPFGRVETGAARRAQAGAAAVGPGIRPAPHVRCDVSRWGPRPAGRRAARRWPGAGGAPAGPTWRGVGRG